MPLAILHILFSLAHSMNSLWDKGEQDVQDRKRHDGQDKNMKVRSLLVSGIKGFFNDLY
jgi:hypothetical protein